MQLIKFIPKPLKSFFQGHERSVRAKKNIALSFIFKGLSILISLMLVPMTLKYLNASEYGVWLTLSSILTWINFFDIGLGNGLRNKLTEALTLNDHHKARIYVSTTFAILSIIMLAFFALFSVVNPFLDWSKILNTAPETAVALSAVVIIVFAFFCLQFVFKTVGIIFIAAQKPALNDLLSVLGSALSLGIIYLLTLCTQGSLYYVAFTFSLTPVIVFVITYFLIFYSKYKFLRPSLRFVKFKYSKDLMGLGLKFFIIQISCLLIFTTSNIIITQILGPEAVTTYNIAFKYFSIVTMAFTIIQSPMWNAYTEAWTRGDHLWIKNAVRRSIQMWGLLVLSTVVMVLCADWVYRLWIGTEITIPLSLSIGCGVYAIITNWTYIFHMFINGIGALFLQLISYLIATVIMIPLSIYLCKIYGIAGVMYGICSILLLVAISASLQTFKIIKNNKQAIWYK
ncbi:MAG: lipopolysaccharide biosynthesis protein [Bacteroidales bacterium]